MMIINTWNVFYNMVNNSWTDFLASDDHVTIIFIFAVPIGHLVEQYFNYRTILWDWANSSIVLDPSYYHYYCSYSPVVMHVNQLQLAMQRISSTIKTIQEDSYWKLEFINVIHFVPKHAVSRIIPRFDLVWMVFKRTSDTHLSYCARCTGMKTTSVD